MTSRSYLSIGDVLTLLRVEFPDVTISKIRFLESQGLVNPERSPSGYRKFFEHDVERLRWVLRQQREHFLPLKVIRDRLADGDLGEADDDQPAEPIRRNGKVPQAASAVVGAGTAGSPRTVVTPNSQSGPGRTEEQSARADDEAMARILADASRRAALIPEGTTERAPLSLVPDAAVSAGGAGGGAGGGAAAGVVDTPGTPGTGDQPSSARPRFAGSQGTAIGATPPPASQKPVLAHPDPAAASSRRGNTEVGTTNPTMSADSGGGNARPTGLGRRDPKVDESQAAATPGSSTIPAGGRPSGPSSERNTPSAAAKATATATTTATPAATTSMVTGASLTADELCAASGLSEIELAGLQGFGLIEPVLVAGIPTFDEDALTVANLAAEFRKFGIEARHLRVYRNAVDREMGLIEQVIIPLLRQRNPESRQRAVESADELGSLGQTMRATLLRSALRRHVGG